jgi:hypothetical protein
LESTNDTTTATITSGSTLMPLVPKNSVASRTAVIGNCSIPAVNALSRIPAHGYYWTDIFPAMMIMGLGLGLVFVSVQIAGNAGVPADKAGLAGALITASFELGAALGLAILSALATARTNQLLARHATAPAALAGGYARAVLGAAFFVGAVVLIGFRAANTKGEPTGSISTEITGVAVGDAAGGTSRSLAFGDESVQREELR